MAISYFFSFPDLGSPAGMVRAMATRSAATTHRSAVLPGVYNL
jgi:hypothetical protein